MIALFEVVWLVCISIVLVPTAADAIDPQGKGLLRCSSAVMHRPTSEGHRPSVVDENAFMGLSEGFCHKLNSGELSNIDFVRIQVCGTCIHDA